MLVQNHCTNVVLSSNGESGGVAGALAKLMLCRISEFVPAENGEKLRTPWDKKISQKSENKPKRVKISSDRLGQNGQKPFMISKANRIGSVGSRDLSQTFIEHCLSLEISASTDYDCGF